VCVWSLMCKRVDRKGRRGSGGIPSVCVLYIEQRRSDTYRVLVGRKSREGGKAKGGGRMDGPREEAFGVHSGGTTQQCGGLRDGERGGVQNAGAYVEFRRAAT